MVDSGSWIPIHNFEWMSDWISEWITEYVLKFKEKWAIFNPSNKIWEIIFILKRYRWISSMTFRGYNKIAIFGLFHKWLTDALSNPCNNAVRSYLNHNYVVVACAKWWTDYLIKISLQRQRIFSRFGLWPHRLFVKWIPCHATANCAAGATICPQPRGVWIFISAHIFSGIDNLLSRGTGPVLRLQITNEV